MEITFEDILFQCNQTARVKKIIKNELSDDDLKKIVRRAVEDIQDELPGFEVDEEELFKQLQKAFVTYDSAESAALTDDYQPWLKYREDINWKYWSRYREYLFKKNWNQSTVEQIDGDTHKILDRLWDPAKKSDDDQWDRRGMVVGNVQSGKTANFTGLICKAADAGFKVIIVLAGMHDSLRVQTQRRLDEEFLGYKSDSGEDAKQLIGVGQIFHDNDWIDTITTQAANGDFGRTVANNFNRHMSTKPILLVVKKNGPVLRNLLKWLKNTAQTIDAEGNKYHSGYPLLLVDDEADNASVDTSAMQFNEDGTPDKDHDPKAINKAIRQILKMFRQSAYVAYTATPQANIYIHEKANTVKEGPDLYPRHFIVTLESSPEYFGPSTVFGGEDSDGLDLVREVDDFGSWMPDRHKASHRPGYEEDPDEMPPSLKKAIHGFILATAVRIARGQRNKHHSMLVHVTRFTMVQHLVKKQVERYVRHYLLNTIDNPNTPSSELLRREFQQLWESDYEKVTRGINDPECPHVSWQDVQTHLHEIIRLTEIREVNGSAKDVLDYEYHREKGLITIAIGGDKLSRGLTLEGLNTSYYLRATKMYDTLMQMGRWFGYRPGYYDLCRLYTSKELNEHYRHITLADIEMREQFRYMEAIGATPKDYGLKVRSHETLLVTSKVKMRSAETLMISFAASRKETLAFHRDAEKIHQNATLLRSFMDEISGKRDSAENGRMIYRGVEPSRVLELIDSYNMPDDESFPKSRLSDYILKQNQKGWLNNWTVYVAQGRNKNPEYVFRVGQEEVLMTTRSISNKAVERNTRDLFYPGILVSRGDETVDLVDGTPEYERAMRIAVAAAGKKGKTASEPDDVAARFARNPRNGLLLIYPVYPRDNNKNRLDGIPSNTPMLGLAISFPENPNDEKIEYVVDNKYFRQEMGYE